MSPALPCPHGLTVVIPTFNRSAELKQALDSLCAQTDPDFEVIVCDDGSTEDIALACAPYAPKLRMRVLRMPNSGSPALPRNAGIQATQTAWISLLDSDDGWSPGRMARVKASLTEDSDIVYHQLRVARADERVDAHPAHGAVLGEALRGNDPLLHMLRHGNPLPNSATTVRRHLLLAMGGFAQDCVEDFDAWLRLAAQGARFKFVPEVLGFYRAGGEQISSFNLKQYELQRKTFARQLQLLPAQYLDEASSQFNYLLGSYALALGLPEDAKKHFAGVSLSVTPRRWLQGQVKQWRHAIRGR